MNSKKLSFLLLGVLLSVSTVYAAQLSDSTYYGTGSNPVLSFEIWKDGSTLDDYDTSMADDAIVRDDHTNYPMSLVVSGSGSQGTLTFYEKRIWIGFIPGDMTALQVDFDGDDDLSDATDAVFANTGSATGSVTVDVPSSELTDDEHLYPGQVQNNVLDHPMISGVEVYVYCN